MIAYLCFFVPFEAGKGGILQSRQTCQCTQLQQDEDDYPFKVLSKAQFTRFAARRVNVTPEGKLVLNQTYAPRASLGEAV
jgi:hypothetical protein